MSDVVGKEYQALNQIQLVQIFVLAPNARLAKFDLRCVVEPGSTISNSTPGANETTSQKRRIEAHRRFLFTREKTCIDCHKGIAHHLPDIAQRSGLEIKRRRPRRDAVPPPDVFPKAL